MNFQCDKCGECCRNLHKSSIYKDLHNGDGVCKYLDGNLCSIYEDRPIVCRVDEFYDVMLKGKLDYDDYIQLNYKYCGELKKLRRK